jgi:hypothetical protein
VVLPAITGTPADYQTLTADAGTWTGTPTVNYAYQWQQCDAAGGGCVDLPGETSSSLVLTGSQVGSTVRVTVTAANTAGSASATSLASPVIAPSPPANTALPTIAGTATEGQTLNGAVGSWSGTPVIGFQRRWQRCDAAGAACADIAGETGATYRLTSADVARTLRFAVTAANAGGTASAASAATAPVGAYLGTGAAGALTATAGQVVNAYASITDAALAAGATSFTVTATTGFAAGDEVLVIQMQDGSGATNTAGTHEFRVIQGIVSTTLTLTSPLANAYASGTFNATSAKAAQIVKVPNYTDVTVPAGMSLTAPAWNGRTGGVVVLRAQGTVSISGGVLADGLGYRGGAGAPTYANCNTSMLYAQQSVQGESYGGLGTGATTANGGGGGGSYIAANDCWSNNGGSGGYGTAGGQGVNFNGTPENGATRQTGLGGGTYGSADLSVLMPGSGGGGFSPYCQCCSALPAGGAGGGVVLLIAQSIQVTGAGRISANGGTPPNCASRPSDQGAGGSGGAIKLLGGTVTLGTTGVTATGSSGSAGGAPTVGGAGRIHLDSWGSLTGATNPPAQ